MAKAPAPALSAAQMEVMEVVWDRGEATVGQVWRALSERRPIARNTVQTTVVRLERKGWLSHREEGGTFHYTAARPRGAAVGGLVRRLLDTAFAGSVSGLVMALLEDHRLTDDEAARLRDLIDRSRLDREESSP